MFGHEIEATSSGTDGSDKIDPTWLHANNADRLVIEGAGTNAVTLAAILWGSASGPQDVQHDPVDSLHIAAPDHGLRG